VLEDVLAERLRQIPRLCAAYLFGSRGRGTESKDSDVDVGIWLAATPRTLAEHPLEYAGELEHALGRRVDLVVMNGAPSDLVHRILRDGKLLVDADRGARIAFEMKARNEYFDLLPTRARYREGHSA
jgi:predicted nucleotidyltransferase